MVKVVTRLRGGLGNQLFQYCAGLHIARSLGGTLHLELARPRDSDLLSQVGISVPIARLSVIERAGARWGWSRRVDVTRRYGHRVLGWLGMIDFVEQRGVFTPAEDGALPRGRRTVRLEGNFQHPSWYEPVVAEVADSVGDFLSAHDAFKPDGHAVVAFRRGDYSSLGWALPLGYYEAALTAVLDRPLYVVSDDPEFTLFAAAWLRSRGHHAVASGEVGGGSLVGDLALLASASAVVMANSTYCWWGTFVGDRLIDRREVTFPVPWLANPGSAALRRDTWTPMSRREPPELVDRVNSGLAAGHPLLA